MTEKLTSNPSNGLPELIETVQTAVEHVEHTNRDLLALTVEVETLRENLETTVSVPEAEARRRALIVGGATGVFGAVQVADWHVETCRISPLINRFQEGKHVSNNEFWCDVSFPTHNHGKFTEVGGALHSGNYVGIGLYSILAIVLIWYWVSSIFKAKKYRKNIESKKRYSRDQAKIIYADEDKVKVLHLDDK